MLALILATISICCSVVLILIEIDVIQINKPKEDKFTKYRNPDGLLGRKKE